jgi:serine/threonine-protein kinase
MRQVCESLAEAHEAGLIHRDIKPANVFLCRRGLVHDFVKVLDFGLVKAAAGSDRAATVLTQDNMATGTPAFMAPEIALGNGDLDGRTDLYALGCLGYWLVTGQFVFERGNAMQVMLAHAQQEPEPPSRRTEQPIPAAFEDLVMRCLEKDPGRRPAGADALRRGLEAVAFEPPWDRDTAERWWRTNVPDLS